MTKKNLLILLTSLLLVGIVFIRLEKWAEQKFRPVRFSPKIKFQIQKEHPDIICVGNSMLGNNIMKPLFEKELSTLAGRPIRATFIISGGLHSAWQYLVLKNHIADAARKGIPIIFFDYEDYFVRPDATTAATGKTEVKFRESMTADEPIFRSKIGSNGLYFASGFPYLYSQRFQIKRWALSKFVLGVFDLTGLSERIKSRRFKKRNPDTLAWLFSVVFRGSQFRGGQVDDRERNDRVLFVGDSEEAFIKKADDSFLPHMLSYSSQYPMIFLVSNSNPNMAVIKQSVPLFSTRLEKYINSKNGRFIDMNWVPELQAKGLMHDSRHFTKGRGRQTNTVAVVKELEKVGITSLLSHGIANKN